MSAHKGATNQGSFGLWKPGPSGHQASMFYPQSEESLTEGAAVMSVLSVMWNVCVSSTWHATSLSARWQQLSRWQ